MSDESGSFWIKLAERLFGLVLIIVGAVTLYLTATSSDALGAYTGLFAFLSIVIVAVGVFLLIVSPPE
jgi:hypothetical protein